MRSSRQKSSSLSLSGEGFDARRQLGAESPGSDDSKYERRLPTVAKRANKSAYSNSRRQLAAESSSSDESREDKREGTLAAMIAKSTDKPARSD
ncbi:hypothetical protein LTR22_022440, partial [Elasticomyces elasticus]